MSASFSRICETSILCHTTFIQIYDDPNSQFQSYIKIPTQNVVNMEYQYNANPCFSGDGLGKIFVLYLGQYSSR